MDTNFYDRMSLSTNKSEMVHIASDAGYSVLDLGCGRGEVCCAISRELAGVQIIHGVDAVVTEFASVKDAVFGLTVLPEFFTMDILEFLRKTPHKYDCIIMSAVLHELNAQELAELHKLLPRVMSAHCTLLIREPLIPKDERKLWLDLGGFSTLFCSDIVTNDRKAMEYLHCSKLSSQEVPITVNLLNYAFVRAYGPNSWEREKHQYRFAYTLPFMKRWAKSCFGRNLRHPVHTYYYRYKDCSYHNHFENAGIPDKVFDSVAYTSGLLVVTNNELVARHLHSDKEITYTI